MVEEAPSEKVLMVEGAPSEASETGSSGVWVENETTVGGAVGIGLGCGGSCGGNVVRVSFGVG